VTARVEMRAAELPFVFDCLDALLADPIVSATAEPDARPAETGLGVVESPRGQTVCAVHLADGVVSRVHLRTGSYANWPSVAHVVPGNLLPDFPLINKSFELCYACADR
jgi:Ni,Fe-hydrogenase III large subunit